MSQENTPCHGLTFRFLGPPLIERDGVQVYIKRRKAITLFAYLAVTEKRHSRDTLATLFWPESDQNSARTSLRSTISWFKKITKLDGLEADRQSVCLKVAAGLHVDVIEFKDRLNSAYSHEHPEDTLCPDCVALLNQAIDLYRGDFLAGFSLRHNPEFDNWQFQQIEALRNELINALDKLIQHNMSSGEM